MDNIVPVHPVNNEYIKEWLVLGPFPSNEIDTDFLCLAGGEENVTPQAGDTIVTPQGASFVWQRYQTKNNIVDWRHHFRNVLASRNAVAYLFCLLETDREETVEMYFANDGQAIVWINGKPLHRRTADHSFILDADSFEAVLQPGRNRCLIKMAERGHPWPVSLRAKLLPPDCAVISGIVTNEAGAPVAAAEVCLEQDANPQAKITITSGPTPNPLQRRGVQTDELGRYRIHVSPVAGKYEISATWGELGARQSDLQLRQGERLTLNLMLKKAISISGTLLMYDDLTPHVGVPVEAVHAETSTVVATTLSDEMGRYQFINLKPGKYQLRCYTGSSYAYYQSAPPSSPPYARKCRKLK